MDNRSILLAVLLACPGVCTPARTQDDGVSATISQRVHPVLIRKEHNPFVQIVVKVPQRDVTLQAMHFSLDGTDEVADIGSLELFATGDQEEFSPDTRVAEPVQPGETIKFRSEHPLHTGKNVFWLSCRLKTSANLLHRISAKCLSIKTDKGDVTPRDLSPSASHRIGVALRQHNDDGVHTYRIPALTTTAEGTLLCVYDMRRRMGRDLQEDIDIGLSRSTDGGQTWQPVRVIMDMGEYGGLPQEQNGCSDPGIIVDRQTGEIFCFAVWMNGKPGKHQWTGDGSEPGYEIGKSAQFLMVRSRDDGRTWTQPVNLTRTLKQEHWWLFAPAPQQGIKLSDGTLVMPAQGRDPQGKEFSTIMTSRDHGEHWAVGAPAYSGGSECQVAQLGDGALMLNMRNEHGRFRAVYVTRDLGRTWLHHATNGNTLIEPNCNGSLLRVDYDEAGEKKHALLFANPHSQTARTHQTIQVSFDDGLTWPQSHHVLLDEGRGAGYPSLTRIDHDHVGIVYEGSQAHLVFEKLAMADLLKPAAQNASRPTGDSFPVANRTILAVDRIPCERIPLGDPDDYKPCIARLPSGELILTAFHQHMQDGRKVLEQNQLFRSRDGGRTWSDPEKLDLLGREPYFTVLNDGTLFLTSHLLSADVRNSWGYTTGFLHRSTDAGRTWQSTRVESEGIKPGASNHTTRNVLQLADGSLLVGVDYDGGGGPYFMWKSQDRGQTWDKTQKCVPRGFQSKYGFFGGETWLWQAKSGKIWALVRVDSNELPIQQRPIKATDDQADHFILFSSVDEGRTFDRIRDFGDYGEMYVSILRLQDQRLLLTFTVRDLNPPLGVRALIGEETSDGFSFDFTHDRLMLDTRTPIGKDQGGGFGPTVQLSDGTLVTSYSYRGDDNLTHLEVVRWTTPQR